MWNPFILVVISSLLQFCCYALPSLSTTSIDEIDQNRIYFGHYADVKDYPYDLPLCVFEYNAYVFFCSASLLTTKFVLTAAHCVHDERTMYVGLGAKSNLAKRDYVPSKATVYHENYEMDVGTDYDIGLIELLKPVEPTSGMTPIKLPSKADVTQTYMGYKAIASGWGRTKHGYKDRLKFLNVTIVENNQCPFQLTSDHIICGMGADFGRVCHGDSGGPLVVQNSKNEIIQIGIVSFGNANCKRGYGAFYTRITRHVDWIEKHSDYKFQ